MSGATTKVPVRKIVTPEGRPMKTVARDDDGDVVFKETCASCGLPKEGTVPEFVDTDTYKAVRALLYQLNGAASKVRKQDDGLHYARVMTLVVDGERTGKTVLRLPDGEYEWMTRVADRVLPLDKEAKDRGDEPQTVGEATWGINAWAVMKQLSPAGMPEVEIPEDEDAADGDVAKRNGRTKQDAVTA